MATERLSAAIIAARATAFALQYKDRCRSIALVAAVILFGVGLALSLKATPDILERLRPGPLAAIFFILLPLGVAVNAADFQLLARLSGVRVRFPRAVEITIYTRAANMLPIPGSMAVRMAALKGKGVAFRRSGGLMVLFTALWGGIGFCFSAAWIAGYAPNIITAVFVAVGAVILSVCGFSVWRMRLSLPVISAAAGLRLLLIILEALVLLMSVKAIGVDAAYHQAAVLVVASFLASVVPAGIGVREAGLAALAPIAGIDPATGFLAGAALRFTAMLMLAFLSGIILISNASAGQSQKA